MVGVRAGQNLAHLPAGTEVPGIGLSGAALREMNAEHLDLPDDLFDVGLLSYLLDQACVGTAG